MAVLADIVTKVRRRVHDFNRDPDPLYADAYYEDSIETGLSRINVDLGTSHTVPTLPDRLVGVLVIRGTIEMCYIRGGEGASADVSDLPEAALAGFSVPNLSITQAVGSIQGPEYWLALAEKLEDDYRTLIDSEEEEGDPADGVERVSSDIEMAHKLRRSMRTGRMTPYAMVRPLPARTAALALNGGTVTISWDTLYHHDFAEYRVERSGAADAAMADPTELVRIDDNHTVSSTDNPGSGRWYYRVVVFNTSLLRSNSTIMSVDVP